MMSGTVWIAEKTHKLTKNLRMVKHTDGVPKQLTRSSHTEMMKSEDR